MAWGLHNLGPNSSITGAFDGGSQASFILDGAYFGSASPVPEAIFNLSGTYDVPRTVITRNGTLRAEPGSDVVLANLEMRSDVFGRGMVPQGGSLDAQENVAITGESKWLAGRIDGASDSLVTITGTMEIGGDLDKQLTANLRNQSQLTWTTTGDVRNFAFITIENAVGGSWDIQQTGRFTNERFRRMDFINRGTLHKSAGGLTDFHVGHFSSGYPGRFVNEGQLIVDEGLQFRVGAAGTAIQTATGSMRLDGRLDIIDNQAFELAGGELWGTGQIAPWGGLIHSGGVIRPGGIDSTSRFVINSDYTQQPGALIEIEIGGTVAESEFDFIEVINQ